MNQDELDALTQNLDSVSAAPKAAAPAKPKAPVPTKEDYAAAAAQMGVVTTPAGEVQPAQVPENLAQAADVVTNESDLDALRASSNLDAASFDDLKR